ncbi:hypothetical protein CcrSwift_gp211 [Caulobacter phage CcrSwift]|uniref:Uncharacterized protein n=1 Tax=Caulobacter phage CcrSwift TaxID=2927984 RepID=K4JT56_9CAUD|nr:hypothetical protein D870_gp210 [Caulobacter phage CcrSwift]AFU88529.1 hypothetical protein CcrSwift_gp211 [Caulobacter phage CcrSwift]
MSRQSEDVHEILDYHLYHAERAAEPGGRQWHAEKAAILVGVIKSLAEADRLDRDHLRLPTSVEEARCMAILGTNYLEDYAPDMIRKDPTGEIAAGRFALATIYQWVRGPGSHFPHGVAKVADALKAFLAELPRGMRRFRHKKRGGEYALVGTIRIQCETPVLDDETLLTYLDAEGQMWGRREAEFMDGRFEEIEA